jgi:aminoglycoside 3-N-acetyltransferase
MKSFLRRFIPAAVWSRARKLKRGAELRRMKSRSPAIAKERLVADLRGLGIEPGDLLMVHSSLRGLGFIEGGPDTVIDALLEAIGPGGTLVMPTFTIINTMKETLESADFVFDPDSSPSTVGRITETFRRRQGVHRSEHPTHSVAAFGPLARTLTETHLEGGTNFGPGSPFAKLLDYDGKIMGLGINFGPVTFYHVYEDLHPDKFPGVYLPQKLKSRIRRGGEMREVLVACHSPEFHRRRIDKTPEIEAYFNEYFRSTGAAHFGTVGSSTSWCMSAREMIRRLDELYARGITIYKTPNLKT